MLNFRELVIRHRSFVGIVCLVVALWISTPSAKSIFFGFFLILAGVFFRAWSSGYINKDKDLATEGPYALTRNPLYFGNFVLGLGLAVTANNIYTYCIFAAYYLLFFSFLIYIERKRMRERFGPLYDRWAKQANLFFPKIKRLGGSKFDIACYMRNREYRVLFFSLLVVALFIIKYLRRIYND